MGAFMTPTKATLYTAALLGLNEVLNGFGLVPSVRWRMSPDWSRPPLELPRRLLYPIYRIYLRRLAAGDNGIERRRMKTLTARLLRHCRQHLSPVSGPTPVPRVRRPADVQELVAKRSPFVYRGFLEPARLQSLTLSHLVANHGEDPVLFTRAESHFFARLADVSRPGYYLANCESLLANHPELLAEIPIARLQALSDMHYNSTQLFLSDGDVTGSPLHCANNENLYLLVQGHKRWTLVHPNHTALAYPFFGENGFYNASYLGYFESLEQYPLFQYCPRLQIELEPGDLLYNPAFCWHRVENLEPRTVAVATRWSRPHIDRSTLFHAFQYGALKNRAVQRFIYENFKWARSPGAMSLSYDIDGPVRVANMQPTQVEAAVHSANQRVLLGNPLRHRDWH